MMRVHLLLLICALLLVLGCGEDRQSTTNTSQQPTKKTRVMRDDENARWVLFGTDIKRPDPASLAEAQEMDEIQNLVDDGLYDQARTRLDTLLENGCKHPQAFLLRAQLHYQRGELEETIPWCNQAIATSNLWIEPRMLLAQTYIRLKRLASAESVLADIDRLAPKLPWGPYGMGMIAAMRGDLPTATQRLDEALSRDPKHLPSLRVRSQLAAQGKDPELEERLLGRYLDQQPDSPWAHKRLGEIALADNRLKDAERSFIFAYELLPSREVARRLAELAQRRNDRVEADFWQQKAGTAAPTDNP